VKSGALAGALVALCSMLPTEKSAAQDIPEVAAEKLRRRIEAGLPPEERAKALIELAVWELAAGEPDAALAALRAAPDSVDADFARARALAALGRWNEAQQLFSEVADETADEHIADWSRFCEAEALDALGQNREAIAVVESIRHPTPATRLRLGALYLNSGDFKKARAIAAATEPATDSEAKWKRYLEARLLIAHKEHAAASTEFQQLLQQPRGLNANILAGATLGLAEARATLQGLEAADSVLEEFIATHPESPWLGAVFRRLNQFYQTEEDPSDAELQKWAQGSPPGRAAFARFYLARAQLRENKRDKGMRLLNGFAGEFPTHPLVPEAFYTIGELLAEEGRLGPALNAFESAMRRSTDPEFLSRAEIAAGRIYFRQKEFVLAANTFRSAADRDPRNWQLGLFNAALAWLYQGNFARFLDAYKELSTHAPESELRRSLLLEEGLLQARERDPRAAATLRLFVKDFPEHHRVREAQLVLAELAFAANDETAASNLLRVANGPGATDATNERAEYLAIFLADKPGQRDDARVIALCTDFLRAYPGSTLKSEVRMKLGQVYFRKEDFVNAQTQFETLARDDPDSPLTETALFLAGRASMQSMSTGGVDRAIELFEEVAKLNGPLKLHARREQAVAQTRLGKENEAVILYDNILAASPEAELRWAALCGKGDNLFTLASKDEKRWDSAIEVFEKLAAEPGVPPSWRNQALYKKGRCEDRRKQPAAALIAYHEVLEAQVKQGAEPEYFWFYKAGFDAAQLLEGDQKWTSAIQIYEKLAAVTGPRADEARARATQLRLEHFVWE
jgi:tetratricopeptide (TPR) repeat protein